MTATTRGLADEAVVVVKLDAYECVVTHRRTKHPRKCRKKKSVKAKGRTRWKGIMSPPVTDIGRITQHPSKLETYTPSRCMGRGLQEQCCER